MLINETENIVSAFFQTADYLKQKVLVLYNFIIGVKLTYAFEASNRLFTNKISSFWMKLVIMQRSYTA